MTIEEAIKHCEEKANGCSECGNEHAQLAEWLKELVKLRENQSKYEKALRQVCDEQLGIGRYRTKEDRDKAASEIAKGYKQWAGIKE